MLSDATIAILVSLTPLLVAQVQSPSQTPPTFTEFGITGTIVASMLGAIGMMLRWLTTQIGKQNDDHKAERKEDRESWQATVREWKDCHKETCAQTNAVIKDFTTAMREQKKP